MDKPFENLDRTLSARVDALDKLARIIDSQLETWIHSSEDEGAAENLAGLLVDARRLIEQTVDMALGCGQGEAPALVAMRADWESRFERITHLIMQRESMLAHEAQKHIDQNRAAQSYVTTGRL